MAASVRTRSVAAGLAALLVLFQAYPIANSCSVCFVNNTPIVDAGNNCLYVELDISSECTFANCILRNTNDGGGPRPDVVEDCLDGSAKLEMEFSVGYELYVEAGDDQGEQFTIFQDLERVGDRGDCYAHLINKGVTVDESSIGVEFRPVGPTVSDTPVHSIDICTLTDSDGVVIDDDQNCISPYNFDDLENGNYTISIRPNQPDVCTRRSPAMDVYFVVNVEVPDPLELCFIDDSPRVDGYLIHFFVSASENVTSSTCTLLHSSGDSASQSCGTGFTLQGYFEATFGFNGYTLEVYAETESGASNTLSRAIATIDEGRFCGSHFINKGTTILYHLNKLFVEFELDGLQSVDSRYPLSATCYLTDDDQVEVEVENCVSPQVFDIVEGQYELRIELDADQDGCRGRLRILRETIVVEDLPDPVEEPPEICFVQNSPSVVGNETHAYFTSSKDIYFALCVLEHDLGNQYTDCSSGHVEFSLDDGYRYYTLKVLVIATDWSVGKLTRDIDVIDLGGHCGAHLLDKGYKVYYHINKVLFEFELDGRIESDQYEPLTASCYVNDELISNDCMSPLVIDAEAGNNTFLVRVNQPVSGETCESITDLNVTFTVGNLSLIAPGIPPEVCFDDYSPSVVGDSIFGYLEFESESDVICALCTLMHRSGDEILYYDCTDGSFLFTDLSSLGFYTIKVEAITEDWGLGTVEREILSLDTTPGRRGVCGAHLLGKGVTSEDDYIFIRFEIDGAVVDLGMSSPINYTCYLNGIVIKPCVSPLHLALTNPNLQSVGNEFIVQVDPSPVNNEFCRIRRDLLVEFDGPEREPLEICFAGDTPSVSEPDVAVSLDFSTDVSYANCCISHNSLDTICLDCTDGEADFNIPEPTKANFFISVVAYPANGGDSASLERRIPTIGRGFCGVVMINKGLVIDGNDISVTFARIGPGSVDGDIHTDDECRLSGPGNGLVHDWEDCDSPYEQSDLSSGDYTLSIRPQEFGTACGSRPTRRTLTATFTIP